MLRKLILGENTADRLYVQYRPDPAAIVKLSRLQDLLRGNGIDGRYNGATELHMTVLHIGILDVVFAQLCRVNPGLPPETFLRGIVEFHASVLAKTPATIRVSPVGLERFGTGNTVIAVAYRHEPDLEQAYAMARVEMLRLLAGWDISQSAIRHQPGGLQLPDILRPHVTLVKSADATGQLPPILCEGVQGLVLDKAYAA